MAKGGKGYGVRTVIREGDQFHRWTAVKFHGINERRQQVWVFRCECGTEKPVVVTEITTGRSVQCKQCAISSDEAKQRQRGPNNPSWKNGFTITPDGYKMLSNYFNHPNSRKDGKILEHTLVMSELLGRPLLRHENVHHKNGVRDDNRPKNLELWSTSQPPGQRVKDKVQWALEIIALYGENYGNEEDDG